jgi:hypothetical protein
MKNKKQVIKELEDCINFLNKRTNKKNPKESPKPKNIKQVA